MSIQTISSKSGIKLRAISRTTVVESVREQLTNLLEERALRPGDVLPSERELMTALGVGRSSLREALSGLIALGVLTAGAGKGYRVRSLSAPLPTLPAGLTAAQVAELFEARRVLESGIAELASLRATDEDFAALEACLESIQRARRNRKPTAPVAARFHTILARAAHNGFLEAQLQGIRDMMVQVGWQIEQNASMHFADEQYEAHKALLDALRLRDPAHMRMAMLAHLDRFGEEAGVSPVHNTVGVL